MQVGAWWFFESAVLMSSFVLFMMVSAKNSRLRQA